MLTHACGGRRERESDETPSCNQALSLYLHQAVALVVADGICAKRSDF